MSCQSLLLYTFYSADSVQTAKTLKEFGEVGKLRNLGVAECVLHISMGLMIFLTGTEGIPHGIPMICLIDTEDPERYCYPDRY